MTKFDFHTPSSVANKLLELAAAQRDTLTPLQLTKLVYLSHGFMLGLHSRPLVNESAEAWTYGPMFRSLYRAVKEFRSDPVRGPLPDGESQFDELEENVIRQVYEKYGRQSGLALSRLTHQANSPWSWARHAARDRGGPISNDLLEDYYSRLAAN